MSFEPSLISIALIVLVSSFHISQRYSFRIGDTSWETTCIDFHREALCDPKLDASHSFESIKGPVGKRFLDKELIQSLLCFQFFLILPSNPLAWQPLMFPKFVKCQISLPFQTSVGRRICSATQYNYNQILSFQGATYMECKQELFP